MIDNSKVVIGAGEYVNNPGWKHTNEEELNLLDENTWQNSFDKNSITAILAEHVWEHLTYEEGFDRKKSLILFSFIYKTFGGIAQLGERLLCTQEVRSSSLLISTRIRACSSGG